MRKGRSVIGKDVLTRDDGRRIHSVKDVIIDPDAQAITALVVDDGGILSSPKFVPIEAVESFGKDAVVITQAGSVLSVGGHQPDPVGGRTGSLLGKRVFTESGQEHGTIADTYFDEQSGSIVGYQVTGGVFGGVTRADSFLPVEHVMRTGADVAYIDPHAVAAIHAETGVPVDASDSPNPLVGRRPSADLEDDDGRIIVANGQEIEPHHVEDARQRGLLDLLTRSAGIGEPQAEAASLVGAGAGVVDAAGSLWDQFTRKLSEMTDADGRRIDEQYTRQRLVQIEDAVGRPVTKVILDRNDDVILNLGDIITHQAVQQAYDSGALDTLLASVYRGEVAFTRDEMKAPMSGTATVEQASGGAIVVEELEQKLDAVARERAAQQDEQRVRTVAERERREQERGQRAEEREREVAIEAERRRAELAAAKTPVPADDDTAAAAAETANDEVPTATRASG